MLTKSPPVLDVATPGPGPAVDGPLRVVLADGHALMRRSLRLVLETEPGVDVVAEASDLTMATRAVELHRPDVLVIDLSMGNGTSIAVIRRLRRRLPTTRIVVLTMQDNPVFADRALAVGALGVVLAYAADDELSRAVRTVARNEEYVSPRLIAGLARLRTPSG